MNSKGIVENNELFEHFRLEVDKGQSQLRIDKFLMLRIENASRNKIQNAAKAGNIRVNNKIVKQNYRVKPKDIISIVLAYPPREIEIIPQNIPKILLQTKKDLDFKVSQEEIDKFVNERECIAFFSTSAKNGTGVIESFISLAKVIYKRIILS